MARAMLSGPTTLNVFVVLIALFVLGLERDLHRSSGVSMFWLVLEGRMRCKFPVVPVI